MEAFALADDREQVLAQLIPGTDEHYYFQCLHLQHQGRLEEVEQLRPAWYEQHRGTQRYREIERRQAMLRFGAGQLEREDLGRELGVWVGHHRDEPPGEDPGLPTRFDAAELDPERLVARAFDHYHLNGFRPAYYERLLGRPELDPERRRLLLDQLQRPDLPGLVEAVAADLEFKHSSGFGSLAAHRILTREQLDALAGLQPGLWEVEAFVLERLRREAPGPETDVARDRAARRAWLEGLWARVAGLAPAFNSLKACLLYHRLDLDRREDRYDRELFEAYLRLPHQSGWARCKARDEAMRRVDSAWRVDASRDFREALGLEPIGDDEALIDDYLQRLLLGQKTWERWADLIGESRLRRAHAVTHILAGQGDPEGWYAQLNDPGGFQALRDRIDLEFAPTNRSSYRSDEPVVLEVDVKHVSTLVLKVFRIQAFNYLRTQKKEIDTAVDLDGLVASEEHTFEYPEPPLRRVRRRFPLPSLSEPGTYVVELIGNGKSSRALIRKGGLRLLERVGAAGHALSVVEADTLELVPDATIWLDGREYLPDAQGEVVIPFSESPRRQQVILRWGDQAALASFQHQGEHYAFSAGLHVERERLLPREQAEVLIRPHLTLNGVPVSLALLERPRLEIASCDGQGVETRREIAGLELSAEGETVVPFQVPDDLRSLRLTLRAEIKRLLGERPETVAASRTFDLNQIDATARVECLHLSRCEGGQVLSVLGKSGEARVARPLTVWLTLRDFAFEVTASLQSDAAGRVELGQLPGVTSVRAQLPDGESFSWELPAPGSARWPALVHGRAGEALSLPWAGPSDAVERRRFSLLEVRRGRNLREVGRALDLREGALLLQRLEVGDYDLLARDTGQRVTIRISGGQGRRSWWVAPNRHLEQSKTPALRIAEVALDANRLRVRLAGASPRTRVHVIGSRFLPAWDLSGGLEPGPRPGPRAVTPGWTGCDYVSGRDLGDEYRYVLERRFQRRFPGNLLTRPGLLLNPWAIRPTTTGLQEAGGGGAYAARSAAAPAGEAYAMAGELHGVSEGGALANLDFLPQAPCLRANLRPDAAGWIEVPRQALGGAARLRLVALDAVDMVEREVLLSERTEEPRDLRLRRALDPEGHFSEQRRVTALQEGVKLVLEDVTTSQLELYDSLGRAFGLLSTLSEWSRQLDEFRFLLDWPGLDRAAKCRLLSEHACHELHFFVSRKDPELFQEVVRPYLAHKRHKTFLDHYLLGDDLRPWLRPWAFQRLNVLERILLGKTLAGEAGLSAQHVEELCALSHPDAEEALRRFRTALQGSALSGDDSLGLGAMRASLDKQFALEEALPSMSAAGGFAGPAPGAAAKPAAPARRSRASESEKKKSMRKEERARDYEEECEAAPPEACYDDFDDGASELADLASREQQRPLYRKVEATQELGESHWYRIPLEEIGPDLIAANAFWRDFARHERGPFLSPHLTQATGSLAELICALAVLDLPFRATPATPRYEGARLELTGSGPALAFHQEIRPAPAASEAVPVLVNQGYLRHDDRWDTSGPVTREKYVQGELLVHTPYVCQVVLTNPTSAPMELDLLLQIPKGALPLENTLRTRGVHVQLGGYATERLEYTFYFPAPGDYDHFPAHAASGEATVASAPPRRLTVVARALEEDRTSWAWISQHGTTEAVLDYLTRENVQRLDLERIAWRLRDREVCARTLDLLVRRRAYHDALWAYGFHHGLEAPALDWLEHREDYLRGCGLALDVPGWFRTDPERRGWYEHLEYLPLINARAHRLGKERKILNDRFAWQWGRFVDLLCHRAGPTAEEKLSLVLYLLLQERVEEALAWFERVPREAVVGQLQYDYLAAYLAFYREDLATARAVAERWQDHPIDRWRALFRNVLAQLDEAAGAGTRVVDPRDRDQRQAQLAASEPSLEVEVADRAITLHTRNLGEVRINYYRMDVELLFSRQPFVQQQTEQFSVVAPNRTDVVELPPGGTHRVPLPEELGRANAVVEVVAAGLRRVQAHYAHELRVELLETWGQLRVGHKADDQPLPRVYVKCYARFQGGAVRFYKDGYTDLRGRFDYASLSTGELDGVERFALLVLSDEHGALVREAAPPAR